MSPVSPRFLQGAIINMQKTEVIPQDIIESKIFIIRGKKVMMDRDLAVLYGVETKMLNCAVRRNIE